MASERDNLVIWFDANRHLLEAVASYLPAEIDGCRLILGTPGQWGGAMQMRIFAMAHQCIVITICCVDTEMGEHAYVHSPEAPEPDDMSLAQVWPLEEAIEFMCIHQDLSAIPILPIFYNGVDHYDSSTRIQAVDSSDTSTSD